MRGSVTFLQYDHGIIRQVSDVLGEIIKRNSLEKNKRQAIKIIDFLDDYVDKYHHVKEDRFLFPVASKISPRLSQMVHALSEEHKMFKARIKRMEELAKRKEAFLDGTLAKLTKEFLEHLNAHIRHEEDVVYPLIEEGMDMDEDVEILQQYDEFGRAKFGPDFIKLSEDFAVKIQDEVLGPGYYKGIS